MMKKKLVGFLGTGALVLVFGLLLGSAQAALNFGGLVGWYNPNFSELNDYLDSSAPPEWGIDLEFGGKMLHSIAVEYEITPNFKFRGEWNNFNAGTSDRGGRGMFGYRAEYKLNVNAYTFSGIYTASPPRPVFPYIGAGLGQFMTKFQWEETESYTGTPWLNSTGSETEGLMGFQVLSGVGFQTGTLLLWGEARYISAEVEIKNFQSHDRSVSGITIDLSGLFLNVGTVIRF